MSLHRANIWTSVSLAALCAAAIAALPGCKETQAKPPPKKPPEVFISLPTVDTVTEYEEFTGRTSAVYTVDVRARVSGYLDQVLFKDGSDVKQGQLLALIDDRSYKAQADSAAAMLAQAIARRDNLTNQDRRMRELRTSKAVSEEQYEIIAFQRAEADAAVANSEAQQQLAQLNLTYTRITAPISGTISNRHVDPGNLIKADDTVLATIVSLDPIYVYFDVNERTVLRLRRLIQEGRIQSAAESPVEVQVSLADEDEFAHRGTINFLDNQVDPNTGTLRVRASIDNANRLLSPGLFVRLRFPVGAPHKALLVQEEALGTDQGQRFLYVINDKNEVAYRRVKVGMLIGGRRVIDDGLQPQDRVIVNGLQRVRPGDKVTIKMSEVVSPASAGTGLAMAGSERPQTPPASEAEPVSFETRNTVHKPVDESPPVDAGQPPSGRER